MAKAVKLDTEAALKVYYQHPEIGSQEICQIFRCSPTTAYKLKLKARKVMEKRGKETLFPNNVNTKCAYEAWGIDVAEIEEMLIRSREIWR